MNAKPQSSAPRPSSTPFIEGVGIGLRTEHHQTLLEMPGPKPWLEVMSDNYLKANRWLMQPLECLRADAPMTLHGVGMSLGSADPLDRAYLSHLRELVERLQPAWVSDHLSWCSLNGRRYPELFPLPHCEQAVRHVTHRIGQVQDCLEQRLVVENVSAYALMQGGEMSEVEFVAAILEEADCDLLLDLNNVYVNSINQGFDAHAYLDAIPVHRVRQFHLAGHEVHDQYLLDAHCGAVQAPVWDLFEHALTRFGLRPALIEWDNALPPLDVLLKERALAQKRMNAHATARPASHIH